MKNTKAAFWKKNGVEVVVMFSATFLWLVGMLGVLKVPVSPMDVLLFSVACSFFLSPLSGLIMKVHVFRWMDMEAFSWPARIVFFIYEGVIRMFLFFLIIEMVLWRLM
jgi:hypothetical protein